MAPEKAPAFQFYPKDFMLGTATMTLAERGAYVTLLCYQWDKGHVPGSDVAALGRLLGVSRAQATAIWATVGGYFDSGPVGWRNARLELERKKQADRRAALAANGKLGGRPPHNQKPNQNKTNRLSVAKARDNQKQSLAFASSSSSSGEDLPNSMDRTPQPSTELAPKDACFARWWAAYPKKIAKQDALKAWLKINPDSAMVDRMLAALSWQRTQPMWLKDGGQFIPYPASYLNSGSYDDEPFHGPVSRTPEDAQLAANRKIVQLIRDGMDRQQAIQQVSREMGWIS